MKTGIIIPCYNEEKRLNTAAFSHFINQENEYHVCFVNDGSKDNTIQVLKQLQKVNPHKVSVIDIKKNAGKAAAVSAGARYLYNRGDIQYIGFIDADLSTDFKDFGDLVQTLKMNRSLSFVFGSRAKDVSTTIEKNIIRAFISKVINILIVTILGLSIKDTQCGAKVFNSNLVPVLFDNNFISKWLFDVEMFIKMKEYFGKKEIMNKIHEQPLKKWIHMDDSKLGIKDSLEIPYRLISIWLNYTILQPKTNSYTEFSLEHTAKIYETPMVTIAA
ncbi:hypothetical protein GCM10022393_24240 [Aquimarina addita]|uniref:dolichyl-phosphate beta-glucosyltransferase n=1 Tax=Aquimarina addita TaxID=870485 RepID=A0ABP6UMK5_9FLAO